MKLMTCRFTGSLALISAFALCAGHAKMLMAEDIDASNQQPSALLTWDAVGAIVAPNFQTVNKDGSLL